MISLTYRGKSFNQRHPDQYVNLGQLCSTHGKRFQNWLKTEAAANYINAICAHTGIPTDKLVIVKRGKEGSWGHPLIAVEVARWISADFGVWCNLRLNNIFNTTSAALTESKDTFGALVEDKDTSAALTESKDTFGALAQQEQLSFRVSPQLIRIWITLKESSTWLTNKDISSKASVSGNTVKAYTRRLHQKGVIEKLNMFPGYQFKVKSVMQPEAAKYVSDIEKATEALSEQFVLLDTI